MSESIGKLREFLGGPRPKSAGTVDTKVYDAKRFLKWLGHELPPPTGSDWRRYFDSRRAQGLKGTTLLREYWSLNSLAKANNWDWPFKSKVDAPEVDEDAGVSPAMKVTDIEALIRAQVLYNKSERYYLAVATTWVVRRIELCRLSTQHYDGETITIPTAKHGHKTRHLIPGSIKPVLTAYHPQINTERGMNLLFASICNKAGVPRESGLSWHGVRRTLRTELDFALAKINQPSSLIGIYAGWSRKKIGNVYGGAPMLGVYMHTEARTEDPFYIDNIIYPVHPFLKVWEGKSREEAKKNQALLDFFSGKKPLEEIMRESKE